MDLSHAFNFGLLIALIPAASVWIYILLGRIWGIDVETVIMSGSVWLQRDIFAKTIGQIRLRVGFGAAATGVRYRGMEAEEYDTLWGQRRDHSYLAQPSYRRVIIEAMGTVISIAALLIALYYFDPAQDIMANATVVLTTLSQIIMAGIGRGHPLLSQNLSRLSPEQLALMMYGYYCLIMITFSLLQKAAIWAENKGWTAVQWLYLICCAVIFYYLYYRIPMSILRGLGMETAAIAWLVARVVFCIYVTGWINAVLMYLYLMSVRQGIDHD